jgi:uncharacterized membrane protein
MNQPHHRVSAVVAALVALPLLLVACGAVAANNQAPANTSIVSTAPVHR